MKKTLILLFLILIAGCNDQPKNKKETDSSLQLEKDLEMYKNVWNSFCLLYTSPSPRDATLSRMPSSA